MREIYFRGKDLDGNWREGDLIWATLGHGQKPMILDAFDECDIGNNLYEVDPDTVGQFTGLHDYDGKEIYEGDILRDTEGRIFQAVWNAGAGAWEFVGSKLHMLFIMTYPDLYKVIGNVYDSPALLEADNA